MKKKKDDKDKWYIQSVTIRNSATGEERVIDNPYFETDGEKVGYKGYKEPADAFLVTGDYDERIKL